MIDSELVQLLSQDDINILSKDLEKGYDSIDDVRKVFNCNNIYNDYTLTDVDILIIIDLRINYKIFITANEIFNREEIIKLYNLDILNIEPELLFNNQKIEILNDQYYLFDNELNNKESKGILYNTKIYIGKENWNTFLLTYNVNKSLQFVNNIQKMIK